jgi:hypothetical protein
VLIWRQAIAIKSLKAHTTAVNWNDDTVMATNLWGLFRHTFYLLSFRDHCGHLLFLCTSWIIVRIVRTVHILQIFSTSVKDNVTKSFSLSYNIAGEILSTRGRHTVSLCDPDRYTT